MFIYLFMYPQNQIEEDGGHDIPARGAPAVY